MHADAHGACASDDISCARALGDSQRDGYRHAHAYGSARRSCDCNGNRHAHRHADACDRPQPASYGSAHAIRDRYSEFDGDARNFCGRSVRERAKRR